LQRAGGSAGLGGAERKTSSMTSSEGARTPKGAEPARPRLLFVSAGLSPRGGGIAAAGRLMLAATRAWAAEHGVSVRVLTLGDTDELPAGVDGEAFAGNRGALARAVWRAQFREGYSSQVYDFLGIARIQGLLPRRLRARYLLYLYGIECWRPLRGSRLRALTGAVTRLACSRHTVARLLAANPRVPAVSALHLALGEGTAAGAADPAPLASLGASVVLIVGRLAPGEQYKGHDELLAATARLADRFSDLQLVVTGDGDDRPRLEAKARELGIADRVRFTGFVDTATLDALYRRCAVFSMPSRDEGFGFVYLEAMRAGKPCVALAGSAAAEIVEDRVTGRLVEDRVDSLTAALADLLSDPAQAARLGVAGRARWERLFTPEVFAARFSTHLDALLAGPVVRRADANDATSALSSRPAPVSALPPTGSSTTVIDA
jgi:phosphatidyl-myo-inositol dimannoside synthase